MSGPIRHGYVRLVVDRDGYVPTSWRARCVCGEFDGPIRLSPADARQDWVEHRDTERELWLRDVEDDRAWGLAEEGAL